MQIGDRRRAAMPWLAIIVVMGVLGSGCRSGAGSDDEVRVGDRAPTPLATLGATPSAAASAPVAGSIVDILSRSADFTRLRSAIDRAGLRETLRDAGPITLFAPTGQAFASTRRETLEAITEDPDQLAELLLAHVVRGRWTPVDLRADGDVTTLQTLAGTTLRVQRDADDVVTVNERATITQPDLEAGNGVVHAIDHLIVPEDLEPAS